MSKLESVAIANAFQLEGSRRCGAGRKSGGAERGADVAENDGAGAEREVAGRGLNRPLTARSQPNISLTS